MTAEQQWVRDATAQRDEDSSTLSQSSCLITPNTLTIWVLRVILLEE